MERRRRKAGRRERQRKWWRQREWERKTEKECVLNGGQEQSEIQGSQSMRGKEWKEARITRWVKSKWVSQKRGQGSLFYSVSAFFFLSFLLSISRSVANQGGYIRCIHIHSFPIKRNTLYNMWDVNWVTKRLQGHEQNKSLHKDGLLQKSKSSENSYIKAARQKWTKDGFCQKSVFQTTTWPHLTSLPSQTHIPLVYWIYIKSSCLSTLSVRRLNDHHPLMLS